MMQRRRSDENISVGLCQVLCTNANVLSLWLCNRNNFGWLMMGTDIITDIIAEKKLIKYFMDQNPTVCSDCKGQGKWALPRYHKDNVIKCGVCGKEVAK